MEVWKRVWKWRFLVRSRVRIWRSGRHTPTKNSHRVQLTLDFVWGMHINRVLFTHVNIRQRKHRKSFLLRKSFTVRFHFTALSRIALGTGACSIVIQTASVEAAQFGTGPCFTKHWWAVSTTLFGDYFVSAAGFNTRHTTRSWAGTPVGPGT